MAQLGALGLAEGAHRGVERGLLPHAQLGQARRQTGEAILGRAVEEVGRLFG